MSVLVAWNRVKRLNTFASVEDDIPDTRRRFIDVGFLTPESPLDYILPDATPLTLEFYDFTVQSTPINRISPPPPTPNTDSIIIGGSRPTLLSWSVTAAGGAYTHPTQTNAVNYYANIDGGGSFSTVSESWILNLRRTPGENVWVATVGVNSTRVSWGWSGELVLGGVSPNRSTVSYLTDQNNIYGNDERWGLGGNFRLYQS